MMNALLRTAESILVSYFDIEIGESAVQHYESISLIEANTKSLLQRICYCFIRGDIRSQNLVSGHSDGTKILLIPGQVVWKLKPVPP